LGPPTATFDHCLAPHMRLFFRPFFAPPPLAGRPSAFDILICLQVIFVVLANAFLISQIPHGLCFKFTSSCSCLPMCSFTSGNVLYTPHLNTFRFALRSNACFICRSLDSLPPTFVFFFFQDPIGFVFCFFFFLVL